MTDQKQEFPPISDPHHVLPVFVNRVVGRGILNGVANIALGSYGFTPNAEGKIDADLVIAARLRLDLAAVHELFVACQWIIDQTTNPRGEKAN